MNKKAMGKFVKILLILIIIVFIIIVFAVLYFYIFDEENYDELYEKRVQSGEIINPAKGLSEKEAIEQFDESFVYYLLYSVKAYNLHTPPLSSDFPKITIYIEELVYNAVIDKGEIIISEGAIDDRDITMITTKTEAYKMLLDKTYIEESFQFGDSQIELIAGKTELLSKGYLELYTELTGKSITGDMLKNIY